MELLLGAVGAAERLPVEAEADVVEGKTVAAGAGLARTILAGAAMVPSPYPLHLMVVGPAERLALQATLQLFPAETP